MSGRYPWWEKVTAAPSPYRGCLHYTKVTIGPHACKVWIMADGTTMWEPNPCDHHSTRNPPTLLDLRAQLAIVANTPEGHSLPHAWSALERASEKTKREVAAGRAKLQDPKRHW